MRNKECVTMLLAGGQGSRLGILTQNIAKPAVPFGGKYRVIDFALSNCANSELDTVGVLTQYQPMVLNSYIGIGAAWDLDRSEGGVSLLPPYVKKKGGQWYKGTANAIYQNINYIDEYNPKYVLILSGDHIYKMNYSKMLDFHIKKKADATISVIEVPWDEASRFGIMNTDEQGQVVSFEEKPKIPKNNLASMGVYVFNWELLRRYLIEDEQVPHSKNDFGQNIIPNMLADKLELWAYEFSGYWKDVGTIESYWEANMDLLSDHPKLDLYDSKWRIYSVNPTMPPNFVSSDAKVVTSLVNEGCQIYGDVTHSVLFPGVYVGKGCRIVNSIVMPNVVIHDNVKIENAIICEKTIIMDGCSIGTAPSHSEGGHKERLKSHITVIGECIKIPKNSKITKGSIINFENEETASPAQVS